MTAQSDSDFQQAFALRDSLKRSEGLGAAASKLEAMVSGDPTNHALKLNFGICLFELGQNRAAENLLAQLWSPECFYDLPEKWKEAVCKYYAYPISARNKRAAIDAITARLGLVSSEIARNLRWFAIAELTSPENLDKILEIAGKLDSEELRSVYERCSAANGLDAFHNMVEAAHLAESDLPAELNVMSLLYGEMANEPWRRELEQLLTKQALAPFDAYRIGLQAIQRLPADEAETLLQRFISWGEAFWACYRPLGILHEVTGDMRQALDAYHLASILELGTRGTDLSSLSRRDPGEVKISCITMCFNDAPLVRHYCASVMPHCDEIIVNDGGSNDGTIDQFNRVRLETGFPISVIQDRQRESRDRTLYNKDSYRKQGLGGALAFDGDRRRTSTLVAAQYDYILQADMDEFFPPFPNLKRVVAAAYGIDNFVGGQCEVLNERHFCDLYQHPRSALPTVFRRNRLHLYAGISSPDEYLSRADVPLTEWATKHMQTYLSYCYHFWHLKFLFDSSERAATELRLGPKCSVAARRGHPNFELIAKRDDSRAMPGARGLPLL
jgi:hypothetical protein